MHPFFQIRSMTHLKYEKKNNISSLSTVIVKIYPIISWKLSEFAESPISSKKCYSVCKRLPQMLDYYLIIVFRDRLGFVAQIIY